MHRLFRRYSALSVIVHYTYLFVTIVVLLTILTPHNLFQMSIHIQNGMLYVFGMILNGSAWFYGAATSSDKGIVLYVNSNNNSNDDAVQSKYS